MLDSDQTAASHVEHALRVELAQGDKVLSGVTPVLTHLLASNGSSLVNEAVVARVRGMLGDLSRQILMAANVGGSLAQPDHTEQDQLADYLASDSAVLSHLYATAMEWQFTERLERKQSIDPVLGPLLQELIGSDDARTAEMAMNTMAAQSRFVQCLRRMEMPLSELPAEHFLHILRRSVAFVSEHTKGGSGEGVQALKRTYDESATRVGLLGRLVAGMGNAARAALDLEHAGFALFSTALGMLTRQPRELAVLACHERQGARLALSLRAAGLEELEIIRQFALLEPGKALPNGIDGLSVAHAQEIIGHSPARGVG